MSPPLAVRLAARRPRPDVRDVARARDPAAAAGWHPWRAVRHRGRAAPRHPRGGRLPLRGACHTPKAPSSERQSSPDQPSYRAAVGSGLVSTRQASRLASLQVRHRGCAACPKSLRSRLSTRRRSAPRSSHLSCKHRPSWRRWSPAPLGSPRSTRRPRRGGSSPSSSSTASRSPTSTPCAAHSCLHPCIPAHACACLRTPCPRGARRSCRRLLLPAPRVLAAAAGKCASSSSSSPLRAPRLASPCLLWQVRQFSANPELPLIAALNSWVTSVLCGSTLKAPPLGRHRSPS